MVTMKVTLEIALEVELAEIINVLLRKKRLDAGSIYRYLPPKFLPNPDHSHSANNSCQDLNDRIPGLVLQDDRRRDQA